MLVICAVISTGYSIFTEELTINGTAIVKMAEQEIEVPPIGEDENGLNRFSVTTNVENLFGMELLRVVDEQCVGNSITTTMQVQSTFAILPRTLTITLQLENNSKNTFTNGKVELLESSDTRSSFGSRTQNLNPVTVEPGGNTTVTISGSINVGRIQTGTYYKYRIYFETDVGIKEFFYTLKLEP